MAGINQNQLAIGLKKSWYFKSAVMKTSAFGSLCIRK